MWQLILISLGLGVGLAMDACAVSISNGLNNPQMKVGKATLMAAMFGFFQALMPMIGWLCVSLIVEKFKQFEPWIPYIALVLLAIIGGKMLYDGIKDVHQEKEIKPNEQDKEIAEPIENTENKTKKTGRKLTLWVLFLQAIATSIDALSTGFSLVDIAGNNVWWALLSAAIIAIVTFAICLGAVYLGKKFGNKLGNKAQILGGVILIAIGLEIFVTGVFF